MFYRCEFWHFRRKPPLIFLKFFGDLMNQIIKEYAGKKCFTINNCRYTFVSCYDIQSLFPCHLLFPTRRLRTFFPLKGILKSLWFYQVWKSSEVKIHSGKLPQIRFQASPSRFCLLKVHRLKFGKKAAAIMVRKYFLWPKLAAHC